MIVFCNGLQVNDEANVSLKWRFFSFPSMCAFRHGRKKKRSSLGLVARDPFSTAEGEKPTARPRQFFSFLPAVSGSCCTTNMLGSKVEVLKLVLHRLKWYMFTMSYMLYSCNNVHRSLFSLVPRVVCFESWALTDVPGTGLSMCCVGILLCWHSTNGASTAWMDDKQQHA